MTSLLLAPVQQPICEPISSEPISIEEEKENAKKSKGEYAFNEDWENSESKNYKNWVANPNNKKIGYLQCKFCKFDLKISSKIVISKEKPIQFLNLMLIIPLLI